jgi:MerR family transcriptional regulator/heat shock protein HspR
MSMELTGRKDKNKPLYPIGIVAELIGITVQTLRLYDKHKLIKPTRRNKTRYYSENDIKWITCIRDIIHNKKISIAGIKKLLEYAPCWEITECPTERKEICSAFIDKSKPCWELNRTICNNGPNRLCEDCVVYIAHHNKTDLAAV